MDNHSASTLQLTGLHLGLPTTLRGLVTTGSVDVGLGLLATIGTFLLRFDGALPRRSTLAAAIVVFTLGKLSAALAFSLYRQSWRTFSFPDASPLSYALVMNTVAGTIVALSPVRLGAVAGTTMTEITRVAPRAGAVRNS